MAERARAGSGSPYEGPIGFSRAIRAGDRVLVSGTGPVWPDGSCDPDPYIQACRSFEIALASVEELGGGVEDVVRTRMYLLDAADWEAVGRAHGGLFEAVRPAATMVVVAGLLDPRWRVEVEVEAVVG
jgi:enamine deaminase RidA (YjgF/YER057c/UK114 family)